MSASAAAVIPRSFVVDISIEAATMPNGYSYRIFPKRVTDLEY
jgi:hypothetical protein